VARDPEESGFGISAFSNGTKLHLGKGIPNQANGS
jgi:hypothetical protein